MGCGLNLQYATLNLCPTFDTQFGVVSRFLVVQNNNAKHYKALQCLHSTLLYNKFIICQRNLVKVYIGYDFLFIFINLEYVLFSATVQCHAMSPVCVAINYDEREVIPREAEPVPLSPCTSHCSH